MSAGAGAAKPVTDAIEIQSASPHPGAQTFQFDRAGLLACLLPDVAAFPSARLSGIWRIRQAYSSGGCAGLVEGSRPRTSPDFPFHPVTRSHGGEPGSKTTRGYAIRDAGGKHARAWPPAHFMAPDRLRRGVRRPRAWRTSRPAAAFGAVATLQSGHQRRAGAGRKAGGGGARIAAGPGDECRSSGEALRFDRRSKRVFS